MAHIHGKESMAAAAKAAGTMKAMAQSAHAGGMGPAAGQAMATTGRTAAAAAGGGFLSRLARHPGVVFGLGIAAGILIYKYRTAIIGSAAQVTRTSSAEKE